MEVRLALTEDFDGWLELLEKVEDNFPGLDFENYEKILQRKILKNEALVAVVGGRVIGTMMFSAELKEIEFLAVHPDFRRRGIGKALVESMLGVIPKDSTVTVTTFRDGYLRGKAAREFYLNLGFMPGKLVKVFKYPCQVFSLQKTT